VNGASKLRPEPARASAPLGKIGLSERDGVRVVEVSGELDMSNIAVLRDATSELPNDAFGIVIDLRRASFIDSATIGLLYELKAGLARRRQRLRLLCAAGSAPRRVLELISFDRDAIADEDCRSAVASIREALTPRDEA
jgi:anti-anti-sigma factor